MLHGKEILEGKQDFRPHPTRTSTLKRWGIVRPLNMRLGNGALKTLHGAMSRDEGVKITQESCKA